MITIHRQDNTFVIEKNGMPYQVIEGMEEYQELKDEYETDKSSFTEELLIVPTLSELKENKKKEINQIREGKRFSEYVCYENDIYDVDELSQNNISSLILMMNANKLPSTSTVIYRSKTNVNRTLTLEQLIKLGNQIGMKVSSIYAISWDLKEQVDKATTKEEVEAITW